VTINFDIAAGPTNFLVGTEQGTGRCLSSLFPSLFL
jgi:hypothetical protein